MCFFFSKKRVLIAHETNDVVNIGESVDSLCRDGADPQYMQYSYITLLLLGAQQYS